jgi:MYXO-CTERM domain-containing protein
VLSLFLVIPAAAEPIFPAGEYTELDQQMKRHGRQFYLFNALPFGLSLDAHVADQADRDLIDQFLAQSASDDVAAVVGQHPFEILSSYGEYGDLGFFGGVALAGTAYEYLTLKREGASAADLERARARVVRAAESWHIFYVITGGGGLVARGIRRMVSEDPSDPPIPVTYPEMVDLFDADGNPLPEPKNNGTYRWDNSGGVLPQDVWIWKDSCSKDQLVGQVFGMVALYEAMKDDPDIDQALVTRMQEDARLVGEMLMTERDIGNMPGATGTGIYDLIIWDADGRPTFHHDLNPYSMEKLYMDPRSGSYNRFNLLMAIGVIKGLHHVSGDERLEEYLYQELFDKRDYLDMVNREEGAVDYIYMGINTNFDNPDMTALALWLGLYLENDPEVTTVLRTFLEDGWWRREGESHTAALCKQPLWHAVYMTLTDQGVDATLPGDLADLLLGFNLGPYWNDRRDNCDADEITAGECLAVDGQTLITLDGTNSGGGWMATEALHPSIRPPSNFDARSNPFDVNGGGGMRLNPGGDLQAAYWIARYMQASSAGQTNLSPNAREHMPVGGWTNGKPPGEESGCSCGTAPTPALLGLLGVLLLFRRRR